MKNFKKRYIFYAVAVITIMLIKGAIYSDVSLEELKKEYTNEASQFIEIDGMQVHYRDEGQGFPIGLRSE